MSAGHGHSSEPAGGILNPGMPDGKIDLYTTDVLRGNAEPTRGHTLVPVIGILAFIHLTAAIGLSPHVLA